MFSKEAHVKDSKWEPLTHAWWYFTGCGDFRDYLAQLCDAKRHQNSEGICPNSYSEKKLRLGLGSLLIPVNMEFKYYYH